MVGSVFITHFCLKGNKNKVFCFAFRNNGKTGMGYNGVAINKRTRREIENISDRKEHEYMIGRKKRK